MRLRRDTSFSIDPVNKELLDKLIRSASTPAALYRRARAIMLLAQRYGPSEAARRSGLHRGNVYIWAARFQARGIAGLNDSPRRRKAGASVVSTPKDEGDKSSALTTMAVMSRETEVRNAIFAEDQEEGWDFFGHHCDDSEEVCTPACPVL